MKYQHGNKISDNINIDIEDFYIRLYNFTIPDPRYTNNVICSKDIPEISRKELKDATKQMKNTQIPGEDKITRSHVKF